jgi:hypothetical protein
MEETVDTTPSFTADNSEPEGRNLSWPNEEPSMAAAWAFIGGWLSGRKVGYIKIDI